MSSSSSSSFHSDSDEENIAGEGVIMNTNFGALPSIEEEEATTQSDRTLIRKEKSLENEDISDNKTNDDEMERGRKESSKIIHEVARSSRIDNNLPEEDKSQENQTQITKRESETAANETVSEVITTNSEFSTDGTFLVPDSRHITTTAEEETEKINDEIKSLKQDSDDLYSSSGSSNIGEERECNRRTSEINSKIEVKKQISRMKMKRRGSTGSMTSQNETYNNDGNVITSTMDRLPSSSSSIVASKGRLSEVKPADYQTIYIDDAQRRNNRDKYPPSDAFGSSFSAPEDGMSMNAKGNTRNTYSLRRGSMGSVATGSHHLYPALSEDENTFVDQMDHFMEDDGMNAEETNLYLAIRQQRARDEVARKNMEALRDESHIGTQSHSGYVTRHSSVFEQRRERKPKVPRKKHVRRKKEGEQKKNTKGSNNNEKSKKPTSKRGKNMKLVSGAKITEPTGYKTPKPIARRKCFLLICMIVGVVTLSTSVILFPDIFNVETVMIDKRLFDGSIVSQAGSVLLAQMGPHPDFRGLIFPGGTITLALDEESRIMGSFQTKNIAKCNKCRWAILTGITCEGSQNLGNTHFYNSSLWSSESPYDFSHYNSETGDGHLVPSPGAIDKVAAQKLNIGYSTSDIEGHAIVVYGSNKNRRKKKIGRPLACGILRRHHPPAPHKELSASIHSFSITPGVSSDASVEVKGKVHVNFFHDHTFSITMKDMLNLPADCEKCSVRILNSKSCETPNFISIVRSGNFWNLERLSHDPWITENGAFYRTDARGNPISPQEFNLYNGYDYDVFESHVIMIKDQMGNPIACGTLSS